MFVNKLSTKNVLTSLNHLIKCNFSSTSMKFNEKWITVLNKDNTSFLRKQYNFKTFKQSIKFINDELVPITKKLKHHPKIILEYNKLTIELTTHDAPYNNNIGDLDRSFAEKLDEKYNTTINKVVLKDK